MPETDAAIAAVHENFRFLVLEVKNQVLATQEILRDQAQSLVSKLFARDDYIDNLKSVIENKCYRLLGNEKLEKKKVDRLRGVLVATANLERIADFAVNIVGQLQYLEDRDVLEHFGPDPFFTKVVDSLTLVEDAVLDVHMAKALQLCRSEVDIDELYAKVFRSIMDELREGRGPEDLVTSLFVYRYFERMGDSLLNVGEAAIFAAAGEKLKISQYQSLAETLEEVDLSINDVDYEGIWETRSGARIGTLHSPEGDEGGRWIIFKEGRRQKVLEEKEGLERWEEVMPGLPPKIFGFHEHGDMASLLLEYLQGETLQKLVLRAPPERVKAGLTLAFETIATVWTRTLEPKACKAKFVRQLKKRLPDVLKVHPEFSTPHSRVGAMHNLSFDELLDQAAPFDDELSAPFRLLIHGDFNTDNLIINPEQGEVHYIDLHRAKPSDYLQDVSVFIVSNFRLPVRESEPRRRLNAVTLEFFRFARDFAGKNDDETFHARLALGLARSFFTSTRFELNEDFSKTMFLRAVYLLERLVAHRNSGAPWGEFRFPDAILVY